MNVSIPAVNVDKRNETGIGNTESGNVNRRALAGRLLHIASFILAATFVICAVNIDAAAQCKDCANIGSLLSRWNLKDPLVELILIDGTSISGIRSIARVAFYRSGSAIQAICITYGTPSSQKEDVVPVASVRYLRIVDVGGGGNPIYVRILPAHECVCEPASVPNTSLEFSTGVGYAGSDESQREIGFNNVFYSAQLLLGRRISNNITIALGLEGMYEGNRLRIPVLGHIRFAFLGKSRVIDTLRYSAPCQFRDLSGESDASCECREFGSNCDTVGANYAIEDDPTVCLRHDFERVEDRFRPFLFLEGGVILDGNIPEPDGGGARPSLNPDEYGQFLIAGGIGLPFKNLGLFDPLVVRLGYRYSRLNLRTPCEACGDKFLVNTNNLHSILLTIGLHFDL